MATVLDILTFLGIAILSVPTLSLNKRKKKLQQASDILERATKRNTDDAFNQLIEEVQEARGALAGQWRRVDEICLFVGYFLLLGSSLLRVFV
ncbi:hypothetical protein AAFO92_15995 [Roseovarius sp. CAU 1744]|uniref:hypothetical protein n=1 Tax=Roseovarius sp. CAU 1744 TaxID=3140368 RepID=UPI00325C2679